MNSSSKNINYALIGYGYWGKIIARNILENPRSELLMIVDTSSANLLNAQESSTASHYLDNLDSITDKFIHEIDIFVIATPAHSHSELIINLAKYKKTFFVTKPLCTSKEELESINSLRIKNSIDIFIDETFIYSNNVEKIKELVNSDSFGELLYVSSDRSNYGRFQEQIDVIWDLAPHDISIVSYVTKKKPLSGTAMSMNPSNEKQQNSIAQLIIKYEKGLNLILNTSWLSPLKTRKMIFGGSKQTIIYDHLDEHEPLKLYNQKLVFENNSFPTTYEPLKVEIPIFENNEPLKKEISMLTDYLLNKQNRPYSDFENCSSNLTPLFNMNQTDF